MIYIKLGSLSYMVKLELIRKADFFKGLSEPTLVAIAAICAAKSLRKDSILFHEGELGQYVYFLDSGLLQLFKTSEKGQQTLIHLVHPGDLFAEVVLFEQETYPVTAVASKSSVVVAIPRNKFLGLMDEKKPREEFLKILMSKLRLLTAHIRRLSSDDLQTRFLGFLNDQFPAQREFDPGMSKKDMAAAMGVTPEAFSRLLNRMKKESILTWDRNIIRLLSADALLRSSK